MKALVLSGGSGTRLRPFSHSVPKQLFPVAGKPVLFHGLEALGAAGITEAGIVVSTPGTAVRDAVGDGSRFGMRVTYLPQDRPLGLAHCVVIAREYLADDDFLMYLGDNIFADGIAELVADFRDRRPAAQLNLAKVTDPSQYGIAEVDHTGRVTALWEKPANPRSDLAVTGAYCFTPRIHQAIAGIKPSGRNEWEITDAVQWLVSHGQPVFARLSSGYWADTGTLGDLLECNKVLLERIDRGVHGAVDSSSRITGPVIVETGATIQRSVITGPAIIGADSRVVDSRIGPFTSLGRSCLLRNAGIEHSILLDDASVQEVGPISGSIIGRSGSIGRARRRATAYQLVVGDDSQVEMPAR